MRATDPNWSTTIYEVYDIGEIENQPRLYTLDGYPDREFVALRFLRSVGAPVLSRDFAPVIVLLAALIYAGNSPAGGPDLRRELSSLTPVLDWV